MQLFGQMNPGKPVPSFPTLISTMVKNDGISSVYRGVDAAIGRQMVYGTARIGLHRSISDYMVEMNEGKSIGFVAKALSGMLSGSIAVCIGTPFDIALVRLQSDGMAKPADRRNYKNVFDVRFDSVCGGLLRLGRVENDQAVFSTFSHIPPPVSLVISLFIRFCTVD